MDIKNLKYSHELLQRKIKLEQEFKMLEEDVTNFQKNCSHIRISFGFESPSSKLPLVKCLFCGDEDVDKPYPYIDAYTYERRYHSTFGFSKRVESGFLHFQKICIESLEKEPSLEEKDLIERIKQEIQRDEKINQKEDRIRKKLYSL